MSWALSSNTVARTHGQESKGLNQHAMHFNATMLIGFILLWTHKGNDSSSQPVCVGDDQAPFHCQILD